MPLTGGLNNEGILLHQLGVEGGQGRPSQLIEKRTTRQQEALLHQRLMLWQQGDQSGDLLPRVYGVLPADHIWRLFLAYVPCPVAAPLDATSAGQLLARLAFRFHCTMGLVHLQESPAVDALLRRQCRRIAVAAADCEALNPDVIRDIADQLAVRLASQKLVLAHNDLHWDNVRSANLNAPFCYQLIDLGGAGWNLAGAEFHTQMRQALMGASGAPIWPHAINHYSELSGIAPTHLKLAALWYGLVRSAAVWKRVSPGGSNRRRQREKRLLTRLVSRLDHELMVSD